MKRQLANILTLCRFPGSIALLFCPVFSPSFYVLYLLCGLTDLVDGTIARATGSASEFGAKLDSAADLLFVAATCFKVLPALQMKRWLWLWIVLIAAIRAANILRNALRRTPIRFLHTTANKVTGFLLFLLPPALPFVDLHRIAPVICAIATVAAVQEGLFLRAGRKVP